MCNIEQLLRPRDGNIRQTTFFLQFLRVANASRVRENTVFKADNKNNRKLKALGRMHRHQSHSRVVIEPVGVGSQCSMIDKIAKSVAFGLVVICGGINEFFKVFEPGFGFF